METTLGKKCLPSFCMLSVLFTVGCGAGTVLSSAPIGAADSTQVSIAGTVHGGQQPVTGATIQLYAVGAPTTGGGYGVGSTPLITGTLPVTDSNGGFTITGQYTVPTAASHFYIVASGGSPGVGMPVNNSIALIAVLGGCTPTVGLSPSLSINISEVTTAAAVMALQPFMAAPASTNTGAPAIGAPAGALNALQNAFATAANLVNITSGKSLTHAQSYATTDNNALLINSLANTLAYCINSAPADGQCDALATNSLPSTATYKATDTIQDAWYIAQNPANNVPSLFNLQSAYPPFIGLTAAPSTFSTPVSTSASACQSPVQLGTAADYAVLAYSTVTNSSTALDMTTITGGNVGLSPGPAYAGFVAGTYAATFDDAHAAAAKVDLNAAYTNTAALLSPAALPADMSGITFTPGLYSTATSTALNSGTVTLDGQGDPNAVFIFQVGSTITSATGTQVALTNGASAANVFWQIGTSATIGGSSIWQGNLFASASITLGTDATLHGRALAENGAVTLASNIITTP